MKNNQIDVEPKQKLVKNKINWSELLKRIFTDFSQLVEKEGQLVKVEIKEKKIKIQRAFILILMSLFFLLLAGLCFAFTAILFINLFTSLLAASAAVTLFFLFVGFSFVYIVYKKIYAKSLTSEKSLEAFSEMRYFVQDKINEITEH